MDHIILMDIGCFFISLGSMYAGSVGTTAVPGPCWHPSPSVLAAAGDPPSQGDVTEFHDKKSIQLNRFKQFKVFNKLHQLNRLKRFKLFNVFNQLKHAVWLETLGTTKK